MCPYLHCTRSHVFRFLLSCIVLKTRFECSTRIFCLAYSFVVVSVQVSYIPLLPVLVRAVIEFERASASERDLWASITSIAIIDTFRRWLHQTTLSASPPSLHSKTYTISLFFGNFSITTGLYLGTKDSIVRHGFVSRQWFGLADACLRLAKAHLAF